MFSIVFVFVWSSSDNPMADIYGANLYNRYLKASHRTRAQVQAQGGGHPRQQDLIPEEAAGAGGQDVVTDGDDSFSDGDRLPEGCSSILVCTGVYNRDQPDLPQDPQETVTEQRIFHGHRDFRFDPSLTQPSFVVQDVREAVELVFQQEGCLLD